MAKEVKKKSDKHKKPIKLDENIGFEEALKRAFNADPEKVKELEEDKKKKGNK